MQSRRPSASGGLPRRHRPGVCGADGANADGAGPSRAVQVVHEELIEEPAPSESAEEEPADPAEHAASPAVTPAGPHTPEVEGTPEAEDADSEEEDNTWTVLLILGVKDALVPLEERRYRAILRNKAVQEQREWVDADELDFPLSAYQFAPGLQALAQQANADKE